MSLSSWTHHSLLKATAPINFASGRLAKGAVNREAREVLREMTRARQAYIEQLSRPDSAPDNVNRACNDYLSLLLGFIDPPQTSFVEGGGGTKAVPADLPADAHIKEGDGDGGAPPPADGAQDEDGADGAAAAAAAAPDPSKSPKSPRAKKKDKKKDGAKEEPMALFGKMIPGLRGATVFKWMDAMSGKPMEFMDAQVELICCLLNLALWECLHASVLEAKVKSSPLEKGEDGKPKGFSAEEESTMREVYQALRLAAEIFTYCDQFELSKVEFRENHDFDERIVESMSLQCMAEAEEVTVRIAKARNHPATIISGVARDVVEIYKEAREKIQRMPQRIVADLLSYYDFKIGFYEATALYENGEVIYAKAEAERQKEASAHDPGTLCAQALKCCIEATAMLDSAEATAKKYMLEKKRRSSKNYMQTQNNDPTKSENFLELRRRLKLLTDTAERERSMLYHTKIPPTLPDDLIAPARVLKTTPFELPALGERWKEAQWNQAIVPFKGEDADADKASSDKNRIKFGKHFAPQRYDDAICSIQ
mmetsp:Transcript_35962/g.94298  ORF Transcript_35962/g.94298 Transcript_35962/m.94298 type:complete len:539 (+) Transcript_35962:74-1690(+)|eukprot:CAMPEP_0182924774 /NCGR_PEP_ID=MMETSP0105_2-20130417/7327_1 /TAXON_ID=81532 ORGANISM="Acanthoeca-like sp., Strain 10tr" /NCGR_SAMPLE_ID=MMETSP0105_2 /ASSEMBLY_ACC=CAM_ASM_000205 /LENGTH=538 /DNA_ID=CAMNT_0025062579 /DNA_START=71 /DNA_END=1687 /DNA_ORIENTATION=+